MFKEMWSDIVNFFNANIWNIILFFAVLVIGTIIIKIVLNISRRMLKKTKMEGITQGFIMAFIKIVLYLVLILVLLSIIGIQVSGIITALSAAILAIGVALQNIIANVANGIVIVSTHMFKKGDWISVGSASGSVTGINFLFTTLTTADNRRITLPNSMLIENEVTNNGSYDTRRVEFTFSVAYETDVELVKKVVVDVMKSNGKVRLDKTPFCRLKNIGTGKLEFFANCWCDSSDYWDVYYYVVENVYNEFKRNNVSVPHNQLEIRERKDEVTMPVVGDALPERVEKVREENLHIDLENASFAEIIKVNKKLISKTKQEKKAKKAEKKA